MITNITKSGAALDDTQTSKTVAFKLSHHQGDVLRQKEPFPFLLLSKSLFEMVCLQPSLLTIYSHHNWTFRPLAELKCDIFLARL